MSRCSALIEPPLLVDRPDPIDLLLAQEHDRLDWLLPVRHSRMAVSAFTFYRGAAAVMAADLARQPHSGVMVQLCGDAHLLNFGFYGTPERQLLFDLNDFDETTDGMAQTRIGWTFGLGPVVDPGLLGRHGVDGAQLTSGH